jgi:hypothetical protein
VPRSQKKTYRFFRKTEKMKKKNATPHGIRSRTGSRNPWKNFISHFPLTRRKKTTIFSRYCMCHNSAVTGRQKNGAEKVGGGSEARGGGRVCGDFQKIEQWQSQFAKVIDSTFTKCT